MNNQKAANTLFLVRPSLEHKARAAAYVAEHAAAGEYALFGDGGLAEAASYEAWLAAPLLNYHGTQPVRVTNLFALDVAGELVGVTQIRHGLTYEQERDFIGHIGYGVRPSRRGQGLAPQILQLALREAKVLGLEQVLLTCSRENLASARTILRCGGVFEGEVPGRKGALMRRYWITLQE